MPDSVWPRPKDPLNFFQLHFLSNGASKRAKTVVAREGSDGKLFNNASS